MDTFFSIKQVENGYIVTSGDGKETTTKVSKSKSELQRLFRDSVKKMRGQIDQISSGTPKA